MCLFIVVLTLLTLTTPHEFSEIDSKVLSFKVSIVSAMATKWQMVSGSKRGRIPRWPCSVCAKECTTNAIFCENCGQWAHSCEDLCKSEFQELSDITCAYICTACRVDRKGKFDFKKSLQRLTEASRAQVKGIKSLREATMQETIFLSNQLLQSTTMKHITTGKIHQYSVSVIENSRGSASRVPRYVTGDGNCLFNSVSVVICGNESMTCKLRVRTCIELVLNFEYYKNHHQFQDFIRVSPDLEEACRMCAVDLEYSSVFVMQALSSVIGREIVSVYPAMNGLLDNCLSILNTVIVPRISTSRRKDGRIYLLWTKMVGPIPHPRYKTWTPDHFVPLIKKPSDKLVPQTSSPINVDSPKPNVNASLFQTTTDSKLDTSSPPSTITNEYSPILSPPKRSWMDDVNPTLASPDISPCNSEINQSTGSKVCDEKQPMSVKSSPDLEIPK